MERREIWINYDRICNFDWTVNWAAILECLLCHHYMSIYILCHFFLNWFILCCLKLYQLFLSLYIWLLKAEPFFWRASKQHFLFSSFNSHLQELLCWASLHFEVSVGINVCLYFYSARSFAMGFPLLLNCCAFQAFCGVLLDFCARTLFFAHFANSSHFYRRAFFLFSYTAQFNSNTSLQSLTRDTDTAHYCQISLQCYFAIQNQGTDTVQLHIWP